MKILHAGNMVNYAYLICKKLREDNLSVDLLMNANPVLSSDPLQYDKSLNNKYPSWIKFYDTKQKFWQKEVIKIMRSNYDLIHAYVELPIFAYLSRRKFIAHPQGSDLREMAFSQSIRGILLRRAYKKAKAITAGVEGCFLLSELKLKNGIFIPPIVDFTKFYPEKIERNKFTDKFVIFHPSHQIWNIKGNDILIKGYKKFVEKYPNSVLIIVKHGKDSEKTMSLIREQNLEKYVTILEGPINTIQLKKYYNMADVVADQFIVGELGGISRETLSLEKPLLTFCWENRFKRFFGEVPPLANASSPEDIEHQLELLQDKNVREKMGKKGLKWIRRYLNPDIVSKKLQTLYRGILDSKKIETIREEIEEIRN